MHYPLKGGDYAIRDNSNYLFKPALPSSASRQDIFLKTENVSRETNGPYLKVISAYYNRLTNVALITSTSK